MKSSRIILLAAAVLSLVACSKKAKIDCTVSGAGDARLIVKTAGNSISDIVDTVDTDADGRFKYSLKVKKGDPEFVHVYNGDRRLASAVLSYGDKVVIKADTLGNYTLEGSEDNAVLMQIEKNYSDYRRELEKLFNDGGSKEDITRLYIRHYRESMKLLMSNEKSIAVIPLMFEGQKEGSPTFSQLTDALIFRRVCDSLKAIYPESRYVKALEKETVRREGLLSLKSSMDRAREVSHPELYLPSMNGKRVSLDSLDAKVVLLHFWSRSEATHKMYNLDVLKPVYEKYHPLGLEIYAVCVDPDKVAWAETVRAQELPWVNVNDGLGTSSSALRLYNVRTVPTTLLLTPDEIVGNIDSESALWAELKKLF